MIGDSTETAEWTNDRKGNVKRTLVRREKGKRKRMNSSEAVSIFRLHRNHVRPRLHATSRYRDIVSPDYGQVRMSSVHKPSRGGVPLKIYSVRSVFPSVDSLPWQKSFTPLASIGRNPETELGQSLMLIRVVQCTQILAYNAGSR